MTGRVVGVWVRRPVGGLDPALAAAMLEDVVDLVAGMQQVDAALVVEPGLAGVAAGVSWPGMPQVELPADATPVAALTALGGLGADTAAIVTADVPDLPVLLLGKLFSALTAADLAVCPAGGGGLVAAAARLPVAGWAAGTWSLDAGEALADLRRAAPPRGLAVGPGWHRVRQPGDLARLDPGLEGWEATRAWLSSRPGQDSSALRSSGGPSSRST